MGNNPFMSQLSTGYNSGDFNSGVGLMSGGGSTVPVFGNDDLVLCAAPVRPYVPPAPPPTVPVLPKPKSTIPGEPSPPTTETVPAELATVAESPYKQPSVIPDAKKAAIKEIVALQVAIAECDVKMAELVLAQRKEALAGAHAQLISRRVLTQAGTLTGTRLLLRPKQLNWQWPNRCLRQRRLRLGVQQRLG